MEKKEDPARGLAQTGTTAERAAEAIVRQRQALERLSKIALYSTPLIVGLLSSDAWSESG